MNKSGRTPLFSVCIANGNLSIAKQLFVHESNLHFTDQLRSHLPVLRMLSRSYGSRGVPR